MQSPTPQSFHIRRVYLLGQFRVETAHQTIQLRGSKIRSLLAYLLLYPERPHRREQIADILWPDVPADRVRRNFSDTLYRLRQALGPDWLAVDREFVALADTAVLWVDVWAFDQAITSGETAVLTAALDLYSDDLLPEIYDDWILGRRLALREAFLNALLNLGQAAENACQPAQALACYQRLAQADPLREEAHRGVMSALARLDRLPDALAAYARLESLLQTELGVSPAAESQALARQLEGELHLTQKAAELAGENWAQRPFIGRIAERKTIFTALEQAINGQGSLIALEGDAGIGKSRLLQEIQAGAEWRKISVVNGRAADFPHASPYAPLADALTSALAPPRAAQIETMLPAAALAAAAPILPQLPAAAPLPDLPPERTRDRFHQAIAAIVGALAELTPHLIILDDLHQADAALWEALNALVPTLARQRLVLLLAYRRPGIENSPGWAMLKQWRQTGQLAILSLQPFSQTELQEWLPPGLHEEIEQIHALTGGNPFYVSEMSIALAEGHAPHGRTAVTRAQSLPEPTQQTLAAAAIIGQNVPFADWVGVSHLPPAELAQIGDELAAHYLLQPAAAGYAFPHELIHQAIYENIPSDRRRQLHRQMADWLAGADGDNWRVRAFHLDRAGAPEAAALYRQAGQQAIAQFAYAEAQAAFERALALTPADPTSERMETLLALAEAAQVTGDREPQQSALEEALRHTAVLDDPALQLRVCRLTGAAAAKTGQHQAAQTHLETAMKLAVAQNDIPGQLDILLSLGDLAIRLGDPETARTRFETAVALAQEAGLPQAEGRALDGVGFAMMNGGGDSAAAIHSFEQALARQRAIGDQFGASRTLVNLLSAHQAIGAWDKALALAEEAYQAQAAVSYRQGMAAVRQAE